MLYCISMIRLYSGHVYAPSVSMMMHLLLLISTCLVCTTNYVVYYVVIDDHYLDADCSNSTLQHYLNKSFASHNQLIFLPGKHHLYTDLVVHNVQNLTLQALYSKEISNTIIYCTRSAHILISSSDDIAIKYMSVNDCGVSLGNDSHVPLVTLKLHSYTL